MNRRGEQRIVVFNDIGTGAGFKEGFPGRRKGGQIPGDSRAGVSNPERASTAMVASPMSPRTIVLSKSKTTGSCFPAPLRISFASATPVS